MIIAHHAIFTTYGTWLPNDPRGSYSKEMYNDQLRMLGSVKYGRQNPIPTRGHLMKFWTTAIPYLADPPFFFNEQSRSIAAGAFGKVVQRLDITVPACAIMNDQVHIVVLRSKYRIEYLVNQLKGAVTSDLKVRHTSWTRGYWKVFIDDKDALLAAIRYVQANPVHVGLVPQSWDFISPLPV